MPRYSIIPVDYGAHIDVGLANPAAGANFPAYTFARPGELVSMRFRFVTAAAVATRVLRVSIDAGVANPFYEFRSSITQTAGLTQEYILCQNPYTAVLAGSVVNGMLLPSRLICQTNWRLNVTFDNIQAADQLSLGRMCIAEWRD
jgi:hypothetical protein